MARATHTCNDVYQVENKVKFLTAEALRGVNSLIFDAPSSRLANLLGKRDYVTGTALEQGCDLDKAVVVQRQAPTVQNSAQSSEADDTVLRRTSSGSPSPTEISRDASDGGSFNRNIGEHSSRATDSGKCFSGDTGTDAVHREDPKD